MEDVAIAMYISFFGLCTVFGIVIAIAALVELIKDKFGNE